MQKSIGVVHGGVGNQRELSLEYGKAISKILKDIGMEVTEMHLHPNGSWTIDGQVGNVEDALKKTSKVWNCLVGVDGERGVLESLCEKCKIQIVGHGKLHSHLSGHKKNIQLLLSQHGIQSPFGKVLKKEEYSEEKVKELFSSVPVPAVVKPVVGGGMWGMRVVNTFKELEAAVNFLIAQGEDVLVEKMLVGVSVSCFVFEHNNLLHTTIKIHDGEDLPRDLLMQIRNDALYIHEVLAHKHHAEYDFIVVNKKGKNNIYFIESNTHPALTTGYIWKVFKDGVVNLREYVGTKMYL